ncbi:calcium-binding protein [Microvirga arabica]|uniref:Calcium-binding protein n=1 Tax=Microvirga arabica TaxID=1128671 RepID=A0ABV6Y6M0_9HYPH
MRIVRVINTDISTDGSEAAVQIEFKTTLILAEGVSIIATGSGGVGISSLASDDRDHSLLIYGSVRSEQGPAIELSGSITVGATGRITGGQDGVYLYGPNDPGQAYILNNAGAISGVSYGARIDSYQTHVVNSGTITGRIGVTASGSDEGLVIHNTGLIEGTKFAAINGASKGSSIIKNQGQIRGDVVLGSGDDVYDGRGGTIKGVVVLDAGSDIAWGGSETEVFETGWGTKFIDGGNGIDTLSYRQTAKVDLRITEQQKTGQQSWETIRNIENLSGSDGDDKFTGSEGGNVLDGGAGNDRLDGDLGQNQLLGGEGKDIFSFSTKLKNNIDVVSDFRSTDDTIHLSKVIFSKIAKGALKKNALFFGSKAKDETDRIGFNKKTGDLVYDADGSGTKYAAVKFAQLEPMSVVKTNDFWIV